MTFWANKPISPDIAATYEERCGGSPDLTCSPANFYFYHKKQLHHLHSPALHVQLHFSAHTLLLLVISFCEKDLQKKINLYFMWKRFQIKNNQKEHLSLIHRGPNTVFNVTNFLQKRGVSINIWTPSIWKLSILVINVGNNLLNQAVWRNIFSLSMKKSCFLVINFIIKQQKKHVVCPWRFQVSFWSLWKTIYRTS